MRKKKDNILRIVIILLLCFGIAILFRYTTFSLDEQKNVWSDFDKLLSKNEVIIEGVIEDKRCFMIISREGREDYGDVLVVYDKNETGAWERTYENDFKELKPWKIEYADIDGDKDMELLIGVYKSTVFDKAERNRLFVFNYANNKLIKKWTGSQIAGEWTNFIAGELLSIPGDELVFIRETISKEDRISIYYWFDFGFFMLAESEDYGEIQSLSILKENLMQITYKKNRIEETVNLMVFDGKIIEVTKE